MMNSAGDLSFSEKDAALLAGPIIAVPNLIFKLGFGEFGILNDKICI